MIRKQITIIILTLRENLKSRLNTPAHSLRSFSAVRVYPRGSSRRECKFKTALFSSAETLSRRQPSLGDSFSPAVNPRIKELIPFGQSKGCERFRVRIISRPGRRRGGGWRGEQGETKRERERNRQEEAARGRRTRAGDDLAKGAGDEERERGREKERETGRV